MPFCTYKFLRAGQLNELFRQQHPLKVSTQCYPLQQSYDGQCCQLLVELSDQFGKKICLLRTKLDPPSNFHYLKGICASEKNNLCVCQ
jgi:hypothetical protein